MNDTKNQDTDQGDVASQKAADVSGKKTLTLKRSGVEHSTVRQNFSHGRTNAVLVETKRRKVFRPDEKSESVVPKPHLAPPPKENKETPPPKATQKISNLSAVEMQARMRALGEAKIRQEQEEKLRAVEVENLRRLEAENEQKRLLQIEQEAEKRRQDELLRQQQEIQLKGETSDLLVDSQAAEVKTSSQFVADQKPAAAVATDRKAPKTEERVSLLSPSAPDKSRLSAGNSAKRSRDEEEGEERDTYRRGIAAKPEVRAPKAVKAVDDRRRGKLTLTSALDEDDTGGPRRSVAAMRRRQEKFKRTQMQETREKISREVIIPETITIQELSQRMTERSVEVIKFLMKQGQMMKAGDIIDGDLAQLIAEEFGHIVKRVAESDVEMGIFSTSDDITKLRPRPPVVTIMGHVDHGKTSLLDAIRQANVVSDEAGGITQHIGAYQIEKNEHKITFIDTPGHAVFTTMRARGAQVTDIAVLVVAADDGVMPQTIESINHAKAAMVPIIVAINKIDKPAADPQKIRTALLQHDVFVESMGGEVLEVELSAKTGQNLDKLLETILLQAEILDLKADPERFAEGIVIEAKLDKGRGPVATVLVQKGTLHLGDIIVAGNEWGRIRALVNERGEVMKAALPATPVEILGMQGTPQAGDRFTIVSNEAQAIEISKYRQRLAREKIVARQAGLRGSLEQMMSQLQVSGVKEFPLVIKGDVQGSVEAIIAALEKLGTDEVRVRIVHSGAGGISESDISLAIASQATIIGFNVRPHHLARQAAEAQSVEIRYYNIIYTLVDDIKAAMSGMLSPERRETFLGNAEILEVFHISKVGKIAGCRIREGKVERGAGVRLIRDNIVIHEGRLKTLKHFKDEVNEVISGRECGMAFENYEDIRIGDIIEAFRVEHVSRSL